MNRSRSRRYNQRVGTRHDRDELLAGAIALVFEEGLGQLTFGRLARRLGISDRMVVYYFPNKNDLVAAVLAELGAQLQQTLAAAFAAPAAGYRAIVATAWPILARPAVDPVFALFFEAAGLAAAGREPYRSLVAQLVDAWIDWVAGLLEGTAARRRAEAETAVAVIDGLLLLRQIAGPAAANRAARGVVAS